MHLHTGDACILLLASKQDCPDAEPNNLLLDGNLYS